MAQVSLRNLSKVFSGGVVAVNDVTLGVENKEFIVLVGPSGCGKSTTLRLIAGLEEASGGDIFIGNRRVNHIPPKDRDIAMVFQNYALYPHMTVYENMAFGLRLKKYPQDEIDSRVKEAAGILGLESLLNRKPKELSGGQRQRVAVGRSIVRKPLVFLFDEPLSNLDAKLRVQMRNELARLHSKLKATMIYVTHDQAEAMTLGDRIVVLKEGFVQQTAQPLEVYNNPVNRFVAGFIGSPAMNFFECEVSGGTLRSLNSAFGEVSLKDGSYTLGIRPEDIMPLQDGSVTCSIEVVETLGNEKVVIGSASTGEQITARVNPDTLVKPGDDLRLGFNTDKFHFFSKEGSEQRI